MLQFIPDVSNSPAQSTFYLSCPLPSVLSWILIYLSEEREENCHLRQKMMQMT